MKKKTTKKTTAVKSTKEKNVSPIVIRGFKGFDKDFKCKDKQYETDKEYSEPEAVICSKGLHFCENPLDIFAYYSAGQSRFASVEGTGKIDKKENDEDTKFCCTSLKIGAEITLHKLIEAGVKFIFERTTKTTLCTNTENKKQASNSGDSGAASNSGYSGAASNSGYRGAASNSGYSGAASNSGYRGAASNSGYSGAASNSGYRGAASNSGYSGAASNSGYRGAASNSGYSGAAFTIGNYSQAETSAKDSVAVAVGYDNKAKGNLGSWIVLAERRDNGEILNIEPAKVDGEIIKADTWYCLKNNKLTEVK